MSKKLKCDCCGNAITNDNYYKVEDKFYCTECMGICHNCDSLELYDDMILTNLSNNAQGYVCSDCIRETDRFFYC